MVKVEPIVAKPETFAQLHRSLLLFYLGGTRSADELLARQTRDAGRGLRGPPRALPVPEHGPGQRAGAGHVQPAGAAAAADSSASVRSPVKKIISIEP